VLMTEKDAVKCGGLGRADLWACPVEAVPDEAFVAALGARLAALAGRRPDVMIQDPAVAIAPACRASASTEVSVP
jgi:hypothetical protein